jgi:hypothetical protein
MELVAEKTLSCRKAEIRRKWAKSDKAKNMRVLDFGQFLIDLDRVKTRKELEELETRWLNTTGK